MDKDVVDVEIFAPVVVVSGKFCQPHLHDNPHHAQHGPVVQVIVRREAQRIDVFSGASLLQHSLVLYKTHGGRLSLVISKLQTVVDKKKGRGVKQGNWVIHQAKEHTRRNMMNGSPLE